jgi:large subunit ribosomal protein L21
MYAVIELGGKQQIVKEGDFIDVDKQQVEIGKEIIVNDVLLIVDGENVSIGQPFVNGASITVKAVKEFKGPKTIAFKYKRRKSTHKKIGGRKQLIQLQILKISAA